MKYDPAKHHRRSIRLKGYDYSQSGAYFVTICVHQRQCLFGEIVRGAIELNPYGQIVANSWQWLSQRYDYVSLGAWVVMPDHFHAILVINSGSGGSRGVDTSIAPTAGKIKSLGRLIGAFKTVSSKEINRLRNTPGKPVWQRNYYEIIIRDELMALRIDQYIQNNPLAWELARLHPDGPSTL